MKKNTQWIVQGALIGALYVVLTVAVAPIGFGVVQFRISEALTILPLFSPAAVPGLFVGCIIANLIGMFMGLNLAIDILFGSLATLLAAILTRGLRRITVKGFPALSFLPPVVMNALIVGLELALFLPQDARVAFWFAALTVGGGELAVVVVLGIPLYLVVRRLNIFRNETL